MKAVREALLSAGYTVDAVESLLGPVASAALHRGELVPALRVTTGGSPLETLVRLFLLGTVEPAAAVAAALPPGTPFVEPTGDGMRAALDLRPYADGWWLVSDLGSDVRPGPLRPDHVLGVGGASVTLAQATVRPAVGRALDLGTGCGVQALHLSTHASSVVATDRNPRAVQLARMTFALNEVSVDVREGDLLEPVAGEHFDLVVCNPPFVVGPASTSHAYKDSGLAGDAVSAALVSQAPGLLVDGGWCQLLANWVHRRGEDWHDRVAGWISGCDAWVLQREVQDPAEYAAMWLRDGAEGADPAAYQAKYAAWLDWFEAEQVEAVGFGIVTLRRTSAVPTVRIEDLRHPVEQPIGPHLQSWFARAEWLRDADLLSARLVADPGLRLEQVAVAGEGWEVATQRLLQSDGLRWTTDVDPVAADLVAGCTGSASVGQLLEVLAAAYGYGVGELTAGALPAVRHLIERGYLHPPKPAVTGP